MLQVVKDLLIVSLFCALPKYDKLKLKAMSSGLALLT